MLAGGSSQEMEGIEVWALFSVAIEGQWKYLTFGERSKVSGDVMQILEPKMTLILGAVGGSKKVNEQKQPMYLQGSLTMVVIMAPSVLPESRFPFHYWMVLQVSL